MSLLVADCPRCRAKSVTFDVTSHVALEVIQGHARRAELFSICRVCHRSTVFVVQMKSHDQQKIGIFFQVDNGFARYAHGINDSFKVERFIGLKDLSPIQPPDFLPSDIDQIFKEGAACLAIECFNAAGTMFRLCLDMATKPLLPDPPVEGEVSKPGEPNKKQRRDLGLRLQWLFDNRALPLDLQNLAKCIQQDANDGAHVGTLKREDAEDLLDFTSNLLERLITEPRRIRLAEERRNARRATPVKPT